MRVLATSDLHYSPHYEREVEAFARGVVAEPPDVLIIAGDVGEGLTRFKRCLDLFAPLPAATTKIVVAGNHDFWVHEAEGHSSVDLLERLLPAAAREAGFVWLETESVVRGRTGFAGSVGWYDYSGVAPGVKATVEEIVALKRRVFVDAWRIDWPFSDTDMSRRVGDALEERLRALESDPRVDRIVVATHVPPWTGGLPRRPEYARTAAFFLNLTLGRRLIGHPRVTHAVAGHIHRGAAQRLDRPDAPPLDFWIIPSDYGDPRSVSFDLPD